MNSTTRLAVKIQNLPDWDVDWFDTHPQQSRQALTISDILPSVEDASVLEKRAVRFLMSFLVSEFSSLSDLSSLVPTQPSPNPVQKSVVAPMELLQKDEKYKSEIIDILTRLMKDAHLSGEPQVCILLTRLVACLSIILYYTCRLLWETN